MCCKTICKDSKAGTLAITAITTAADDIHKYFSLFFRKIRLGVSSESSARQRIHMKNQALFSSKDKSEKLKCRLLPFLLGALKVNLNNFVRRCSSAPKRCRWNHIVDPGQTAFRSSLIWICFVSLALTAPILRFFTVFTFEMIQGSSTSITD